MTHIRKEAALSRASLQRTPSFGRFFRGFTLIELMVSIALAGVVVSIASVALVGISKHTSAMAADVQLDDDAKMLMEILLPEVQAAGGANVRPWMGINVADGAGDNGSDELTLSILDPDFRECTIVGFAGVNVQIAGVDTTGDGTPDSCCLANGNYASHRLLVTNVANTNWFTVQNSGVTRTGPAPNDCRINGAASSILSELSNVTPFQIATGAWLSPPVPLPASGGPFGSIGVVRTFKFFKNSSNQLIRQEIITGTGADLQRVLADNVFDFQVSLGYDAPSADGFITDLGSTADEWMFNADLDSFGTNVGTPGLGTRSASPSDLRMAKIAVVHGIRQPYGTVAQALNGLPVDGTAMTPPMKLRVATGTVSFRNLFLFQ